MGWYSHVLQSEDGSRLAMWERRLKLLPRWLRGIKRQMINVLPRYHDFRRLMARQFADPAADRGGHLANVRRDFQEYHGVAAGADSPGVPRRRRRPLHSLATRASPRRSATGWESAWRKWSCSSPGHDYRRKGLATAVRAVRKARRARRPVRLLVVGGRRRERRRGPWPQRRGDAAIFVGPVDDPVPYYAAADALVLPSFYDPFGLVVLEAAACGLPVVTSRATGASELLSEGREGYVLDDPADVASWSDRLERLLDPARRRAMGEAARRLALQYTLERNCDALLAIYQERVRPQRCAA